MLRCAAVLTRTITGDLSDILTPKNLISFCNQNCKWREKTKSLERDELRQKSPKHELNGGFLVYVKHFRQADGYALEWDGAKRQKTLIARGIDFSIWRYFTGVPLQPGVISIGILARQGFSERPNQQAFSYFICCKRGYFIRVISHRNASDDK